MNVTIARAKHEAKGLTNAMLVPHCLVQKNLVSSCSSWPTQPTVLLLTQYILSPCERMSWSVHSIQASELLTIEKSSFSSKDRSLRFRSYYVDSRENGVGENNSEARGRESKISMTKKFKT